MRPRSDQIGFGVTVEVQCQHPTFVERAAPALEVVERLLPVGRRMGAIHQGQGRGAAVRQELVHSGGRTDEEIVAAVLVHVSRGDQPATECVVSVRIAGDLRVVATALPIDLFEAAAGNVVEHDQSTGRPRNDLGPRVGRHARQRDRLSLLLCVWNRQ